MKERDLDLDIVAIPSEDTIIIHSMSPKGVDFYVSHLSMIDTNRKVTGSNIQKIMKLIREQKLKHSFRKA